MTSKCVSRKYSNYAAVMFVLARKTAINGYHYSQISFRVFIIKLSFHGAFMWCIWPYYSGLLYSHWGNAIALQWASYQIRKIAGCACTGNAGNVPPTNFKGNRELAIQACITARASRMSGSLTRGGGKTFQAFPAHAQPAILRIW